jgi:tyrosine-protein phosphatase SIW14
MYSGVCSALNETFQTLAASKMGMRRNHHRICAFVAGAALCLGPISPVAAAKHANPDSRDVPHTIAEKIRVPGVANFGEVTPTLFRGAQPTERGFENLSKMGVAIVVDLREGSEVQREEREVTALGMKFVAISWNCTEPKDEYFAKFLTVLRSNPDKKVFVHCHVGVDRTGMMIASYRMADQGWTAEEARREMKTFGFSMLHEMMCSGLGSYEGRFPSVVSDNPAFQVRAVAQKADVTAPVSPNPPTPVSPKQ